MFYYDEGFGHCHKLKEGIEYIIKQKKMLSFEIFYKSLCCSIVVLKKKIWFEKIYYDKLKFLSGNIVHKKIWLRICIFFIF